LQHFTSLTDVLLDIFSHEVEDVVHRVMMLLAGIWDDRNNLIWNQKWSSSRQFCSATMMNLPEWSVAQPWGRRPEYSNDDNHCIIQWCRPSIGVMKCNVDASFSQSANKDRFWVLRS